MHLVDEDKSSTHVIEENMFIVDVLGRFVNHVSPISFLLVVSKR